MPTLPGSPGAPRPRRTRQDRGVGRRLQREPDDVPEAGPIERALERADVLDRTREVVDEQRRAVLARERLEVGAVDRQAIVDHVEAGPAPPGGGRDRGGSRPAVTRRWRSATARPARHAATAPRGRR